MIGVIGISIGLSTSVFALVDGVLFKSLGYRAVEELYLVQGGRASKSIRDINEWAAAVPDVTLTGYRQPFVIGAIGGATPVSIRGAAVDGQFFSTIGSAAALGGFVAEHFAYAPGPMPAMISDRLWGSAFARDSSVVGRRLPLAGAVDHMGRALPDLEVVGVLPADFVFPSGRFVPDVILPMRIGPGREATQNDRNAAVLARVPVAVVPSVEARLTAVARTQGLIGPGRAGAPEPRIWLRPLAEALAATQSRHAQTILGVAVTLLMLACVNAAALAVARRRQHLTEVGVRQALGASRADLWRFSLCQALPLGACGMGLGLWLTAVLLRIAPSTLPQNIALLKNVALDGRTLGFAIIAGGLTTGIVSAALMRRPSPGDQSLRQGLGFTPTAHRGRVSFVVTTGQTALTCVLLAGGVLLVGSLWNVWREENGFEIERALVFDVNVARLTPEARALHLTELIAGLRALSNVEAVGVVGLGFLGETRGLIVPAIRRPEGSLDGDEHLLPFSGDLFRALGVKVIQGRAPTEMEVETAASVVLVSQQAARRLWPGTSPVGQMLVGPSGAADVVIGVVADARYGGLDVPSEGQIYKPTTLTWPQVTIAIRSRGEVADTLEGAVHRILASGPSVSLVRAQTLRDALESSIRLRTFRAWLFAIFAVASLLLTCTGIIGTVVMSTALRTREMAIRSALGARPKHIFGLLALEPLASLLVGGLAGAGLTLWLVQFAGAYLFQIEPHDPRVWGGVAIALIASTVLATVIPALHLTRVDVMRVLKTT